MNEELLEGFYKKIEGDTLNEYSPRIKTNLLHVAEDELKELGILYQYVNNRKNRLSIYSQSASPFQYTKGFYPSNTKLGRIICNDKFITQKFLNNANIKTPVGSKFTENEFEKAKEFIKYTDASSFVLKPVSLSMSRGASLGVNFSNLEHAWRDAFQVQKQYKVKRPSILIQEQINGLELRIIVVEGEIGSAIFRAPGNIVGDGIHSIEELIHIKNEKRKKHNYLKRNLLKIDKILVNNLSNKGLNLNTVLPTNKCCILYSETNIATGREVYEVSKYLDKNIFKQVLEAVTVIPGIQTAGVDIFVENLDAIEGTIIEVNTNPAFQLHYYPMTGTPSRPLYDVFKYDKLERKILNKELEFDELTRKDFELLLNRYRFLHNKQQKISDAFELFLEFK